MNNYRVEVSIFRPSGYEPDTLPLRQPDSFLLIPIKIRSLNFNCCNGIYILKPALGFEPKTFCLLSKCSTAELCRHHLV